MRTPPPRGSVVVGIDDSPHSRAAVAWASDEAERKHLPLHLLHAVQRHGWRRDEVLEDTGDDVPGRCLSDAVHEVTRRHPSVQVSWSQPHGSTVPALTAASRDSTLVVVGSQGRGRLLEVVRGSTAVELMADSRCPVVVVRTPSATVTTGPVVVGIRDDLAAADTLHAAFGEAADRGCNLVVVHASDRDVLDRDWAWRLINEQRSAHPEVPVELHSVRGDPADALIGRTERARLLVLGSRGRHELGGAALGSVGQVLIRHSCCPVLVARTRAQVHRGQRRGSHVS